MSDTLQYLETIRRMIETTMVDAEMDDQLCQEAKDRLDEAFTALDMACSAQDKKERE